jgi:hypothetical protein
MSECKGKNIFVGIVIILAGVLFLLHNLGYIHGSVWRYWPVLLIIWGIKKLL